MLVVETLAAKSVAMCLTLGKVHLYCFELNFTRSFGQLKLFVGCSKLLISLKLFYLLVDSRDVSLLAFEEVAGA